MKKRGFYGKGIPGVDTKSLTGLLIVIEGADGSGRSTQSAMLQDWLGKLGYPTAEMGIKRSALVAPELEEAMQGNTLNPRTISLFYATDFADQLENSLIPALRAGFIVIADRYIYTLMARDIVRGSDKEWLKKVYDIAVVPDLRIYLKVKPETLAERSFQKTGSLNYWESGMDIQRSGDMYQCFIRYQNKMAREFKRLADEYDFVEIDGNRDPVAVHRDMQTEVTSLLQHWKVANVSASKAGLKRNKTKKLKSISRFSR